MRLEDYERKVFDDFLGLYANGEEDQVPEQFFADCLNVIYNPGEVRTREGLSNSILLGYGGGTGNVRRFVNFFTPYGIFTFILDDANNLYINGSGTPLITVTGATDFSAIQILGKIYIAFHNGNTGLAGINLKVFIPSTLEIRDAAGPAPIGTVMTIVDGAAGSIISGDHLFAVVYETNTGFLTPPGPKDTGVFTPTTFTAGGDFKADISNIPVGPSYVSKRHILATKAGQLEYFFVPDGNIDNNTDTTKTVDFFDENLVESADYLFDELETIPVPLGLDEYKARMITYGENGNDSILRVSLPGEPEAFVGDDGIVIISEDDGFQCKNSVPIRDVLYVHKNLGVFAVIDNGDVPANWQVIPIDRSINTPCHGIGEFFDLSGIKYARDMYLTVDRSGILLFSGVFRKPPITDNIKNIWKRINFDKYHKVVLSVDEQHHRLYCSFPIDGASENNYLLMGDYSECSGGFPEPEEIKWSTFELPFDVSDMGLIAVVPDTVPTLKFGSLDGIGKILKLDPSATSDDGTSIDSFVETGLLSFDPGNVHFWTAIMMRIIGLGDLMITIRGLDNVDVVTPPNIVLSLTPGKDILSRFNMTNERAKIKLRVNGIL